MGARRLLGMARRMQGKLRGLRQRLPTLFPYPGVEPSSSHIENMGRRCQEQRTCRVCYEEGGRFISPCNCKGTIKWVHKRCWRDAKKCIACGFGVAETRCWGEIHAFRHPWGRVPDHELRAEDIHDMDDVIEVVIDNLHLPVPDPQVYREARRREKNRVLAVKLAVSFFAALFIFFPFVHITFHPRLPPICSSNSTHGVIRARQEVTWVDRGPIHLGENAPHWHTRKMICLC